MAQKIAGRTRRYRRSAKPRAGRPARSAGRAAGLRRPRRLRSSGGTGQSDRKAGRPATARRSMLDWRRAWKALLNSVQAAPPSLSQPGWAGLVVVCDDKRAWRVVAGESGTTSQKGRQRRRNPARRAGGGSVRSFVRSLAAAAHPQRMAMLTLLLSGAGRYAALRMATRLKVGPLYYHIRELRTAGLLQPKKRDIYELTVRGRQLALALQAVASLGGF